MRHIYNFNAGPAMLPDEVLLKAQAEMLDWHGLGMSVMEIGHRGPEFQHLAQQAEADLRELMGIPKNYVVLFLAGGATTQFAMVPLNLMKPGGVADYIDTGVWSHKAISEAKRYGKVNVAAEKTHVDGLSIIPQQKTWNCESHADYLHYTPNETIEGLEFQWVPQTGSVPLVADMTSMILSRPINVSSFGVIYAGAQKNVGQAGLTLVIIREDLISEALEKTPSLYSYKLQAENHSFYNTPPTYSWYIAGLMFEWLKQQGGVEKIYEINKQKAQLLYHLLDQFPDFYTNRVHPSCRSLMNVTFNLPNENLAKDFISETEHAGLKNLLGHRASGGMRASIYNAMPLEGVKKLADVMMSFAKKHGC